MLGVTKQHLLTGGGRFCRIRPFLAVSRQEARTRRDRSWARPPGSGHSRQAPFPSGDPGPGRESYLQHRPIAPPPPLGQQARPRLRWRGDLRMGGCPVRWGAAGQGVPLLRSSSLTISAARSR